MTEGKKMPGWVAPVAGVGVAAGVVGAVAYLLTRPKEKIEDARVPVDEYADSDLPIPVTPPGPSPVVVTPPAPPAPPVTPKGDNIRWQLIDPNTGAAVRSRSLDTWTPDQALSEGKNVYISEYVVKYPVMKLQVVNDTMKLVVLDVNLEVPPEIEWAEVIPGDYAGYTVKHNVSTKGRVVTKISSPTGAALPGIEAAFKPGDADAKVAAINNNQKQAEALIDKDRVGVTTSAYRGYKIEMTERTYTAPGESKCSYSIYKPDGTPLLMNTTADSKERGIATAQSIINQEIGPVKSAPVTYREYKFSVSYNPAGSPPYYVLDTDISTTHTGTGWGLPSPGGANTEAEMVSKMKVVIDAKVNPWEANQAAFLAQLKINEEAAKAGGKTVEYNRYTMAYTPVTVTGGKYASYPGGKAIVWKGYAWTPSGIGVSFNPVYGVPDTTKESDLLTTFKVRVNEHWGKLSPQQQQAEIDRYNARKAAGQVVKATTLTGVQVGNRIVFKGGIRKTRR